MRSGRFDDVVCWCARIAFRLLHRRFGSMEAEGTHHIPRRGAALIAARHESFADSTALVAAVPRRLWFLATIKLTRRSWRGWLVRRLFHTIEVTGGQANIAAVRRAVSLLCAGEIVVVYPEGRYAWEVESSALRRGVAWLALRTGAPVIPALLRGTAKVLPPRAQSPRPAHVCVEFKEPIRFAATAGPPSREVVAEALITVARQLGHKGAESHGRVKQDAQENDHRRRGSARPDERAALGAGTID
jgi:1-acyl-sn-glycerol-3-phosphate acyltransferase